MPSPLRYNARADQNEARLGSARQRGKVSRGEFLKGYLLDTGIALVAMDQPEHLRGPLRTAIERGPGVLSVVSFWEVIIKSQKKTLDVGDPRAWWDEALYALALKPLLLRPAHIAEIYQLPLHHSDPFDRALIAQAISEELTLLTADTEIPRYASHRFRVLR